MWKTTKECFMSDYNKTEDYDISSSYIGDEINNDDKNSSSSSSSDSGMDENERGHTNFSDNGNQR
jgi:hypothetical protein